MAFGSDLPDEAVEEFLTIYAKEFGETLEFDEAKQRAKELLVLMEMAMRP